MSIKFVLDHKSDFEVVFERAKNDDFEACVFKGDALVVVDDQKLYRLHFKELADAMLWAINMLERLIKGKKEE